MLRTTRLEEMVNPARLQELMNKLPSAILNLPILASLVVFYVLVSYTYAWFRLRHIPGPFLASFSYLYILWTELGFRQGDRMGDLCKKYGNLVRIGPNDVLTGDPDFVRRINGARSRYSRAQYYRSTRLTADHDNLFSITDTGAHDRLKARMTYGYGGKDVPSMESDMNEVLSLLVHILKFQYASSGRTVDFATLSRYFALDVITKIAYGEEFGFMKSDQDLYGIVYEGQGFMKAMAISAEVPWLSALFINPTLQRLFGPRPDDKRGFGVTLGLAKKVVGERFGPEAKDKMDMLASLDSQPRGSFVRHGLTQRECEAEVPFQIIAGSDTTARTIRGTMLYLMAAPNAYHTLQKEIDNAVRQGIVSNPVRVEEAKRLPYLQGCIYEGLRLSVPVTILGFKQCPPEGLKDPSRYRTRYADSCGAGDTTEGHSIPGGTRVAVAAKSLMTSAKVFGDDADVFRPERWLNLDIDTKRVMTDTAELIFGYGRWACSGKPVAMIELNKVFIQLVNPQKPFDQCDNINIHMDRGMWVRVTDRNLTGGATNAY
ncbi:uncharacterized protein E0L32_004084 [Thyridium curvatum]|uniref:Cytochrome P450 n=1 Tax=Thyridium curvatum TaxID=1093900 RepID=A0A507BFL7_9PEZI|nr:uncharacterized protein E0L32_004084 [Thyridium curvatum]TPX16089.1 hypothetical protein E0L32_004084 [Thyridium curvatum]